MLSIIMYNIKTHVQLRIHHGFYSDLRCLCRLHLWIVKTVPNTNTNSMMLGTITAAAMKLVISIQVRPSEGGVMPIEVADANTEDKEEEAVFVDAVFVARMSVLYFGKRFR